MASLGYDYGKRWASGPGGTHTPEYRLFKEKAAETFLARFDKRLPKGFRDAVRFSVPATPLTFERFTNNAEGSFMGFHIRQGEYGKFFPLTTPVDGLYFAGQWVYPGFGVAATAASGYYCAKAILEKKGMDVLTAIKSAKGGAA
jgi:phytoene dehydrogenase-like protein